ncbi:MAG TPA: DHA2 family efflux MFS transporter permease subunit [Ktedonobacteraceae bacterium]|nr:DHA2 family efflux MFS transporter permease subunit [Ktedonobacteraceae bacterium]
MQARAYNGQVNGQIGQTGGRLAYKWIVAMVVILGVFMSILDQTIVNIAIPRLQTAFGADIHSVQWVLTAYILTQGVVTPTAAFFSETFGIKRFYIMSLAAFTIGSALCGIAWSLPVLILFRILQGAGGAALFPLSITLLFREFPPQERGTAMGFFGIPALLAPAIGPTFGGYLVTYAGWQLIFYINVPVGIIAIILCSIFLREYRPEARPSFDVPGFIFAAAGLASVLYALSDASTDGWGSTQVIGFMSIGLILLAVFVAIELIIANRGGYPLLDLRLFANGPFRAGNIANVFVTFSLFGGIFLFPIYLQNLRSLSAFQAGVLLLPQALASMVSVIIGGRLVDRIGVRAVMIPGLILLALANWELSFMTIYSPYLWIQAMLILRGLALGATIQPLTVATLAEIRPQQLAQASSINTVTRSVSSSLGIAVLATLVQTQAQVHFAHLAELVTPGSPTGGLLREIEAYLVGQGINLQVAQSTAIQVIAGLVQQQAYMLAIEDAFRLTVAVIVVAIIATLFVGSRRHRVHQTPSLAPGTPGETERSEAALTEAMMGG